ERDARGPPAEGSRFGSSLRNTAFAIAMSALAAYPAYEAVSWAGSQLSSVISPSVYVSDTLKNLLSERGLSIDRRSGDFINRKGQRIPSEIPADFQIQL